MTRRTDGHPLELEPGARVWIEYENCHGTIVELERAPANGVLVRCDSDGVIVNAAREQLLAPKEA